MKKIKFLLLLSIIVSLITIIANAKNLNGYSWPIDRNSSCKISQTYSSSHGGIDISAPYGTAIKSAYSGTVVCSSMKTPGANDVCSGCGLKAGYHVVIKQDDGMFAVYAHMSKTTVSTGTKVSSGQKIGEVGSTGISTGNHLHFAFFNQTNGWFSLSNSQNPMPYLTPFCNVYAADITSTNATLSGLWGTYGMPIQKAGFYIGTSSCSMKKISKNYNLNYWNDYYGHNFNLNNDWGTLKNGTTYYFQLWVSIDGVEYKSDLCTFVAGKANWSQYVHTSDIPGHSYVETSRAEATCSKAGTVIKTCSSCGDKITQTLPATGLHTAGTWVIEKEATTTSTGLKVQKCIDCQTTLNASVIPPLTSHTHTWDSGTYIKATTTQPAKRVYTCTSCGEKKTETITSSTTTHDGTNSSAVILNDTALKATPAVDAKLDDAYLNSLQVKINPPEYAGVETDVRATVYSLYDDNFVYVFFQVENDQTLLSADDDYIQDHPHPNHNDVVEVRIGDDLEEKLPEYTGSNAAHHLFIMDAYGKRFSCYEDAIEDYLPLMKGATEITSPTSYNVEMRIPLADSFEEGDIIQFNFQVSDCQDAEENKTGYIGLGKSYMTLVDFKIGGEAVVEEDTNDSDTDDNAPESGVSVELSWNKNRVETTPSGNTVIFGNLDFTSPVANWVSKTGIYLYDSNKSPLGYVTESIAASGSNIPFSFNVQEDLRITLEPGTQYYYVFMALINGEPTYSPVYTFTTDKPESGLDNFKEINTFNESIFPDIKNGSWYSENVKRAYVLGLLYGNEKGFDPDASITVAQVITLAARIHSIYNTGSADFVQGSVWYQVFVDYCIDNGIIGKAEFTSYNAPATRAEFVEILSRALPEEEFDVINSSAYAPDVTPVTPSYNSIYTFYRAGILAGSDEAHSFFPDRSISRAETAAILTRIIDKSMRLTFN